MKNRRYIRAKKLKPFLILNGIATENDSACAMTKNSVVTVTFHFHSV